MRQALSKMALPLLYRRQHIVVVLLMTCFAPTLTAPTIPVLGSTESFEDSPTTASPIIITGNNGMLPAHNEMLKERFQVTTTNGNLIGEQSSPEAATAEYDNGTIKIHEANESASTEKSDLSDAEGKTPENKNIPADLESSTRSSVSTTIEMPIKLDADNANVNSIMTEGKKAKLKEGKGKKALKALEKKQKFKQSQKFSEVNHFEVVKNVENNEADPTFKAFEALVEPTLRVSTTSEASKLEEISSTKATQIIPETTSDPEIHTETTHESTISTSIKTAPTTIKSTTLTTMKSSALESEVTGTEAAFNEITTKAMETETTATTEKQQNHDNVIILNTNSSGLIVVDIMENFGKENASNETEPFEIKMDLIDDVAATTTEESRREPETESLPRLTDVKDDIFLTTIDTLESVDLTTKSSKIESTTNDDIILINVNLESTSATSTVSPEPPRQIKWNELKNEESSGNIKITFDNVDLPNQNVNVSIENGELVIDSIDISVLNKAEEEFKKRTLEMSNGTGTAGSRKTNKTDSLEIILIEDDSHQEEKEINRDNLSENEENYSTTKSTVLNPDDNNGEAREEVQTTTIHFDMPPSTKSDRLKKIEIGASEEEDGIKIKTTDKDSDTVFYISNTEVKVIESIPTMSPNVSQDRKYYPAIYEEDVIVDVPQNKNRSALDKYEEDIVLSPLTSDFDPKDINYIGEAFLDVEESQNNGASENHHIIPLTSDVVIQPVKMHDAPSVGIPIIGELPPQIELEEMVFSDDYDNSNKQQSNFRIEEYFPNFLSNRLVKSPLEADVPKEYIIDTKNITFSPNRTHISINTSVFNGTNMTAPLVNNTFTNPTAFLVENDEAENSDLNDIQTLLLACFATLTPLFLCVIIALTIRYCWRKYHRQDSSGNDMTSDKSTDPLAGKNASSADELKTTDSGMTLDGGGNMEASTELLLAANGDITPTNHNGTNGSIITMTLKNNHLIVETEERNDISRDTRETKMHYSPSEKDGVFIVESARGADQNGSHKPSPLQQKPKEAPLVIPEEIKIDTLQSHFTPSSPEEEHKQPTPEQVEVHTPPAELKDDGTKKEPEAVICNGTKTGLSQSDLSLTSSNSSNQNYTYGDRDTYQYEEKGYKGSSPKRIINVHNHDLKPLIENSPPTVGDNNKPVITSAIFKNDTPEDNEPLKSDMQASDANGPTEANPPIDKTKVLKLNGLIKNGLDDITSVPDENCNTDAPLPPYTNGCHGELDSLSFLPAPPEELANDQTTLDLTSMDSLPPPPPEMTEVEAQS